MMGRQDPPPELGKEIAICPGACPWPFHHRWLPDPIAPPAGTDLRDIDGGDKPGVRITLYFETSFVPFTSLWDIGLTDLFQLTG